MVAAINPMASTWRDQDPSAWNWKQRIIADVDKFHNDNGDYPIFKKTDPIPWFTQWSANRWVLTHSAWPILLQWAYVRVTGQSLHPIGSFVLYVLAMQVNLMAQVDALRRLATKTGFLDGDKHSRDKVPDIGVDKLFIAMPVFAICRPGFSVLFAYRASEPIRITAWLPVELFLYSIVLDLFFYIYHRATHEIDGLWRYHRTHHLTKHPTPILTGYADHEQEAIEIAVIPLLTYFSLKLMGFPMTFYDWWICSQYIVFAEAFGHSGLRVMSIAGGPAALILRLVNAELALEDHDLHHRQGWRKSGNYGKQTRVWDRIFGTCLPRVESRWANVDYANTVSMPWF